MRRPRQEVLAAPPTILSVALLEKLWEGWQVMELPPGGRQPKERIPASPADLDRVGTETGIALPYEARVWWGWGGATGVQVPTGDVLSSLSGALETYCANLKIAEDLRRDLGMEEWFPSTFWPIVSETTSLGFDLTRVQGRLAPIVAWDVVEGAHEPLPVVARSLGELVDFWIERIHLGYYSRRDLPSDAWMTPVQLARAAGEWP